VGIGGPVTVLERKSLGGGVGSAAARVAGVRRQAGPVAGAAGAMHLMGC
jgi:hypothetical protein